jgi:hypothetical protein
MTLGLLGFNDHSRNIRVITGLLGLLGFPL